MRIVILFVVAMLVGCASSTGSYVRGPDGEGNWAVITCRRAKASCYEMAGQFCPNGYVVADQNGYTDQVSIASYNRNNGFAYAVPVHRSEMLIKCKSMVPRGF